MAGAGCEDGVVKALQIGRRRLMALGAGRTLVRLPLEEADALLEKWGLSRGTGVGAVQQE